jgi:hypothetical protein
MSEIKLELRYPESRPEDITDAFMRGYTAAVEASMKLIKERKDMNAKLRELVTEMFESVKYCCSECWLGYGPNPAKCENENCGYRKEYFAIREMGIEVTA